MRQGRLGGACALALLFGAAPAFAGGTVDLGNGVKADWTLNGSAGTRIRLGTRSTNQIIYAPDAVGSGGNTNDAVSDDGDLNYDKGDFTDGHVQAYGNINLKYKNFGIFAGGMAWYDYVKDNQDVRQGNAPNGFTPNSELSDDGFDTRAKFGGAVFQQAYAYGHFKPYGHKVDLKVGRQLILWGRSLFARGALTSLNAINLPAYHRPGSTLNQFFNPASMVKLDFDLTKNLSAKTFYQFNWQSATTDGCGTFLDSYDNVHPGCNATFSNQALPVGPNGGDVFLTNRAAFEEGLYFRRGPDRDADSGGQYGIKLNYAFDKHTHVGGYFFNYNARLPVYSLHKNTQAEAANSPAPVPPFNAVRDFYEYPNDIKVYGLTADKLFSNIGRFGINISYIPNDVVLLNTPDITNALADTALGENPQEDPRIPNGTAALANNTGPGEDLHGYKELKVVRQQATFDTVIPNVLKADKTTVSVHLAFEEIPNLPDQSKFRFGRHNNFGLGAPNAHGYVTDFSWGYELEIAPTYEDAIGQIDLEPKIEWRQGVHGYSSDEALQEHQKSLSVGLGAQFNKHLGGDISYTHYNTTKYSVLEDRDYISFSTSYSF